MDNLPVNEAYVCVDIETSGPIPGAYSMLSIGACTIFKPQRTFYIEIKPINQNSLEEAASIHKFPLDRLTVEGAEPVEALKRFEEWLITEAAYNQRVKASSNVVVLDADVARIFPNSASVNKALHSLVEVAQKASGLPRRSPGPGQRRRAS